MPKKVKTMSFGGCRIAKTHPPVSVGQPVPPVLNIVLTLEEALKLNLAISECIRKVNSYKRSTKAGKAAGINVAVKLDLGSIDVVEGKA